MEQMSRKQKLENYWYYYKVHTLVGIGVLLVGLMVWLQGRSSDAPIGLNVDVLGGAMVGSQAQVTQVQKDASVAVFGLTGAKQHTVGINVMPMSGNLANPSNYQVQMSLMARISAKSLDVVILDPSDYHLFLRNKLLTNLAAISAMAGVVKAGLGAKAFGLPLSPSTPLKSYVFAKGTMVGILLNSPNLDNAVLFVRWVVK